MRTNIHRIVYAVYLPGSKENSGGHVVLHKLVKLMCELGYEVWTTRKPFFDCNVNIIKESTGKHHWDMSFADGKNLIAIYPETVEGNEFRAKNVVRWILYHAKPEVESTWNDNDVYFYYAKSFNTSKAIKKRMLTVIDAKTDVFINKGLVSKRKGCCHIIKKKQPRGEKMLEYFNSVDLSDFMEKGGFSYLADELNKYEYFVTYDDATYYSIAAALCGCKSIILNPDPRITPDDFREGHSLFRHGVAYGWCDLNHAIMTRDLLKEDIIRAEKNSIKEIKVLNDFWENRIANGKTN
jgi:hypothetical protein